jgi:hypothetical protein
MTKYISTLISVIAFTTAIGNVVAGVQQENESRCARSRAAAVFRKIVMSNSGTVEVFHVQGGIVALATADNPKGVAAIQAGAREFIEQSKAAVNTSSTTTTGTAAPCLKIQEGLRLKKIFEQSQDFSRGVLLTLDSRDPQLSQVIFDNDCCDFCTCPSGTVTHCAKCC